MAYLWLPSQKSAVLLESERHSFGHPDMTQQLTNSVSMQLAANATLPVALGGADGTVLYIGRRNRFWVH